MIGRVLVALALAVAMAATGLPSLPAILSGDPHLPAASASTNVSDPLEVETFAGDGTDATVDGVGEAASFRQMGGVTVAGGFAYVGTNGSIRKVNLSTKQVTTLAGHATQTGCTDNSDPAQVRFTQITDITTDGDYLYTATRCTSTNYRVRRTAISGGATSHVAVVSRAEYLTIGPDGMLYVSGGQGVWKVNPTSGVVEQFAWMSGTTMHITADSTYLWMRRSSSAGRTIERFNLDGTYTTFPDPKAGGPLESVGEYLLGGHPSHLRRYLKADPDTTWRLAGSGSGGFDDGVGTDAWFYSVVGIASDGADLWIADYRRLRKATEAAPLPAAQPASATSDLGISMGMVVTTAGNGTDATVDGTGTQASFREMGGVVAVEGSVYVGTRGSIRKVDPATKDVTTLAGHATQTGCADSTDPQQVRFDGITDIATDGYYLYTVGNCGAWYNGRVRRTSLATGATSTVASLTYAQYLTFGPDGIIYTTAGQGLWRMDPIEGDAEVFVWYGDGKPQAITSDDQYLWMARAGSIQRIGLADGTSQAFDTNGSNEPLGIGPLAIESAGRYLYALSSTNAIRIYDKQTKDKILTIAGWSSPGYADGQGTAARFSSIKGIVSDGERLWVADNDNRRLRKVGQGFPTGDTMGECSIGTGWSPLISDEWMAYWCAFQADPVNSADGSFYFKETDATFPGIGVPFSLERAYHSNDETPGAMGPGWTHSYEYALVEEASGDVNVELAGGGAARFALQPDGSYWGGPGARATLEAVTGGHVATTHSQMRYRFDSGGRLTKITDRNGNEVALSYDASGDLDSLTDTAGRTVSFTHDASGLLTSVALPGSRSVSYGYTGGLLSSVTDLRGKTWTYEYDASDRLTKITDPNLNMVAENTYGTDGRVASQKDPLGYESTFSWDADTQTSTMTDARGGDWKDVYEDGRILRRIDPAGNATRYHYAGAQLTGITDPRGNRTSLSFDTSGNLRERVAPAPLSYTETWDYDAQNNVTSHTDTRGKTTTFEYDASGNLTKMIRPGAVVTLYGRDPAGTGLLASETDPRGKTTTYGYDADGNLNEIVTPDGNRTTMSFDASGRMTSVVEARGNEAGATPSDFESTFTYDDADHMLTQTDPLGNQTAFSYDDVGNLKTRTDAEGRTTTFGYNAANELSSVEASDQTVTAYAYDEAGNLISRTDAKNHSTTYAYDAANRLVEVTNPVGSVWTYTYDEAGNLLEVTDANGNATPASGDGVTAYTYDELNRVTGIDFSDATPDAEYDYDEAGNVVEMRDGAGTETYGWDDLGRLTGVARGGSSFSYLHDDAGNLTRRTYPDGTVVDLAYTDDGRLGSVTVETDTTTYSYNAAGMLTETAFANGTNELRTYDRAGRPIEVRHEEGSTVLSTFSYAYDGVGNPTEIQRPSGTTRYEYDALDRLTEACRSADCSLQGADFDRYTYDEVGNRLTEEQPAGDATYAYDAADRLLSRTGTLGSVTYDHDENGNLTEAGSRSLSWDLRNLLSSTSEGGTTISYAYDGMGKRLQAADGSDETNYLWDPSSPLPEVVRESDASGNLIRRYAFGADLVSMTDGADEHFYLHDALGTVTGLTDQNGDVAESYDYGAFGEERGSPTPGASENPMRFAGEYLDADTELYHLRARQYDPGLGRFLSTDPLAPALTDPYVSAYVYANNRSTFSVDPSGLRGVPGLWEGGFFSVWRDGFQVTPLWVKIAVGAGIVIPAGYLAGPALLSASVRAAAFARGPGSNLLAGLFGLFAGTTTKSTAEVFGSNGPTASGLGGCVGTALPAFFMGGGGGLVALACGAGVLFGLGVDRK